MPAIENVHNRKPSIPVTEDNPLARAAAYPHVGYPTTQEPRTYPLDHAENVIR